MRFWIMLAGLLAAAVPAAAQGLFEARSIVTGMDDRSRPEGLRRALGQVLAKAAGLPSLEQDERLAGVAVERLLTGFIYLDRMSDIPRHDEQGSRDRPFDLVARFDPDAVADLLHAWGETVWTGPRPVLAVEVTIHPRVGGAVPLRADTDADERHRGALLAAAERFGLAIAVPAVSPPVLPAPAGAARLEGVLRWSDAAAGWVASWRLAWAGGAGSWEVRGVGFDAAYRAGVGGAAARLSGHGGAVDQGARPE